jgi:nucleotide-binding universal stress UspA family protein
MKTILVPIGGGSVDAMVLETALAVARPLSAHLELLHVRVGAAEAARHTPHLDFARGAGLTGALDGLRARAERRSTTAEHNVRDFCATHDIEMVEAPRPARSVTARWRRDEGEAMQRLLFHARHNDLVVMARHTGLDGLPPDRLETLLMGCGRPLLIAPAEAPMRALGTAMVCWKETRDAARAVSAAMPLLTKARRVLVVSVSEDGEVPSEAVHDVVHELAWNGIAAESHVLARNPGTTADTLFAAARTHAADLMVMGAYGHRHLREVLFGGCTQSAIEAAQCAVFLVH